MNERIVSRVRQEIEILAREIGGTGPDESRIKMGKVSLDGREYVGVIIEALAVNPAMFHGAKAVRALVLLPPEYPDVPPLGIYVNRDHVVASSHFVRKGYHGAPSLQNQGWRWFCHGVGTFDTTQRRTLWRPAANPHEGHNLATAVAAARVAMNQNN